MGGTGADVRGGGGEMCPGGKWRTLERRTRGSVASAAPSACCVWFDAVVDRVTTHHRPPRSTTIYQLLTAHNYRRIEPVMLGGGKPPISDQSRRSGVGVGGGSQPLFTSLGMGSAARSQAGSGAKIRPLKCFLAFFYRRQMGSPVTCWRTSSGRHGLLGLPLNPPMIGHNDKRR